MAIVFVVCVVSGLVILAGSSYLPASRIASNVSADVQVFVDEGLYPSWPIGWSDVRGDNFTDAWILNLAMIETEGGRARNTLLGASFREGDPIASLQLRTTDSVQANTFYHRYWHGHIAITRPLLLFMTYSEIRTINRLLILLCCGIVAGLVWRRLGWGSALSYALAMLAVGVPVLAGSIQFVSVFYVAAAGTAAAALLTRGGDPRMWDLELFGLIGILAAFFDLLTAPALTWGVPAVVLIAAQAGRRNPHPLVLILRSGAAWVVGYIGFWATKWAINILIAKPGSLEVVGEQIEERVGTSMGLVDRASALELNLRYLFEQMTGGTWTNPTHVLMVTGATVVAVAVTLIMIRSASGRSLDSATVWVLAVGAAPFAWYLMAADHSTVHAWFTFRSLAVTLFAVGVVLARSAAGRRSSRGAAGF